MARGAGALAGADHFGGVCDLRGAMLPVLGQPVCGTLLTLVVLQVMALHGWIFKIGVSLVVGLGSFYLFSVVLGVPLPAGRWWPW